MASNSRVSQIIASAHHEAEIYALELGGDRIRAFAQLICKLKDDGHTDEMIAGTLRYIADELEGLNDDD